MKDFLKAYKLYFKSAYSPILIGVSVIFNVFICLAMIFRYAKITDEGYMSMIGTIGMSNLFLIIWLISGKPIIANNKFFLSASCNKALFTTAPIAAGLTVEMIYGTILITVSYFALERAALPDVIIMLAFNMVFSSFIISMANMPKMLVPFIISDILLFSQPVIFSNDNFKWKNGFGFELPQAVLIAAVMLIVGIGLNIIVMNLWWNKSGRSFKIEPQKNILVVGNK
ncbi:MAG: hypothetical protein IJN43_11905 [Ruminococcus sp.]|nr:hypothetical protein [Ruminococcus sp.]